MVTLPYAKPCQVEDIYIKKKYTTTRKAGRKKSSWTKRLTLFSTEPKSTSNTNPPLPPLADEIRKSLVEYK